MQIQFIGAARTVTGSKHLITTSSGKKILLDCGLFQNKGSDNETMNRHLGFDPRAVDFMILSHAHIDHSGNIPYLIKQGFKGKIFCTLPTYDLCEIMLADSAHIHEQDVAYINRTRQQKGMSLLKPLYEMADVLIALKQFEQVSYNEEIKLDNEISFQFTGVGHILGAAAINLRIIENGKPTRLFFSGDIGRPRDRILKAPEPFPQADYLIIESTYGNRLHDDLVGSEQKLLDIVIQTCIENEGKLIIPAFSLGRTQEIVYALDQLKHRGLLPPVKVYVDSPLSINATNIMRKHPECFNDDVKTYMLNDEDPFGFNNLVYIQNSELSKELNKSKEPCIIISASGMMEAGRIKHHLRHTISDEKNTVLIVGYCTPESLGGQLISGKKRVKIFGDYFDVRARVEINNSYSAHADFNEMIEYITCQDKSKIKGIFLVHGEYEVQRAYKETLLTKGFKNIEIPAPHSVFEI